jgi:hypothetical protein
MHAPVSLSEFGQFCHVCSCTSCLPALYEQARTVSHTNQHRKRYHSCLLQQCSGLLLLLFETSGYFASNSLAICQSLLAACSGLVGSRGVGSCQLQLQVAPASLTWGLLVTLVVLVSLATSGGVLMWARPAVV